MKAAPTIEMKLDPADTREDRILFYTDFLGKAERRGKEALREAKRWLNKNDLFYLLVRTLHRVDVNKDWLFERCKEIQAEPNGYMDLWARMHYKSTIITFALTIQDIIKDAEITIGIFSHTRPTAKGFLKQIMRELEGNEELKELHSDVLWANPKRDAPKWSEDDGIIVKRKSNPKESTVEAWGMVDGLPTGKHFKIKVYDDVIDVKAVNTPEMITKVTTMWELSIPLGTDDGVERYIGTRYHTNDPYAEILRRDAAIKRVHKATVDGSEDGDPVFMSKRTLRKWRKRMGPYTFAAQMLQDPTADRKQGFKREWLRQYPGVMSGRGMTKYILVDPASKKKKSSDYTVMMVIGLGADRNRYLLDMIRDRLNLTERRQALFALHRRWRPRKVGYEEYGLQSDIEYMKENMERDEYRFDIVALGGKVSKEDRIKSQVPHFEEGHWYIPDSLIKTNYEGTPVDLINSFVEEEYMTFPVPIHDDMLDTLARIDDGALGAEYPKPTAQEEDDEDRYARPRHRLQRGTWMSA
jgi:predicted phage terminase large subunit-like protein